MKIHLHEISVGDLVAAYSDNDEIGVVAYGGKLDVRPAYQREFVYGDKERNAVIDTVRKSYPLNVMYWAQLDDGRYEVIDGQQRTLSICRYVDGEFSIDGLGFHNLKNDQQSRILDYKLMIYFCEGTDSEKLEWFKTINIAGLKLTEQELRNAVYAGPWTTDAKRYFSKVGCVAYQLASKFVDGVVNRQAYLETAISWHSEGSIEDYMSRHQHDANASALWVYFQAVVAWAKTMFPTYRQEMKHVDWGALKRRFGSVTLDIDKLEACVRDLMMNDDVGRKVGIYAYVLDGDDRHLNIRAFSENMRREAYERQGGVCVKCNKQFPIEEMEADHVKPWHEGGKTSAANCQMLCKDDNRRKSGK